jgi:hypothetical protein
MGVQAAWASGEYRISDPQNWHKPGEWSFWPPTAKPAPPQLPAERASVKYKPINPRWGESVFETMLGMAASQLNGTSPDVNNRTTYLPGSHASHDQNNTTLGSQAKSSFAWPPSWVPLAIGGTAAAATLGWAGRVPPQGVGAVFLGGLIARSSG